MTHKKSSSAASIKVDTDLATWRKILRGDVSVKEAQETGLLTASDSQTFEELMKMFEII